MTRHGASLWRTFRPNARRCRLHAQRAAARFRDMATFSQRTAHVKPSELWDAFHGFQRLGHFRQPRDYADAIAACRQRHCWEEAVAILWTMQLLGLERSSLTHGAAVAACEKAGRWEAVLALLGDMRCGGLVLDVAAWGAVVSACGRGSAWQRAMQLVLEMRSECLVPNIVVYGAAVSACGRAHQPGLALQILREDMRQDCVKPDIGAYGAALLGCTEAHQWQQAVELLQEMPANEVVPDVAMLGALLAVCEQLGSPDVAAALLWKLGDVPDVNAFGAISRAAIADVVAERLLPAGGVAEPTRLLPDAIATGVTGGASARLWSASRDARVSSKTRYAKEFGLLEHVFRCAHAGDPASVCAAVEQFGEQILGPSSCWLKVAGGGKAQILARAIRNAPPWGDILEIGTYCGYSAVRIAIAAPGTRVVTLEVDPVHALIARNLLIFAGLAHAVDVHVGHSVQLIPLLAGSGSDCARPKFRSVFLDSRGSRYCEELDLLERHGFLDPGAVVVADNVLKPGAPLFLWRVTSDAAFRTEIVSVREFAMPSEDWMTISVRLPLPEGSCRSQVPTPPLEVLRMHRDAEWMRSLATSGDWSVPFEAWALFAAEMRERLASFGISASSAEKTTSISLDRCGQKTNQRYHTKLIDQYGKQHSWRQALDIFMRQGPAADVVLFNACITACAKARRWSAAMELFFLLRQRRLAPDVVTYNAAILASSTLHRWPSGLWLLRCLQLEGLAPTVITYTSAINACSKGSQWAAALVLLRQLHVEGLRLDVSAHSAAIAACGRGNAWTFALDLLAEAHLSGLKLDLVVYSSAVSACRKGLQWDAALQLVGEAQRRGLETDAAIWRAAGAAYESVDHQASGASTCRSASR